MPQLWWENILCHLCHMFSCLLATERLHWVSGCKILLNVWVSNTKDAKIYSFLSIFTWSHKYDLISDHLRISKSDRNKYYFPWLYRSTKRFKWVEWSRQYLKVNKNFRNYFLRWIKSNERLWLLRRTLRLIKQLSAGQSGEFFSLSAPLLLCLFNAEDI